MFEPHVQQLLAEFPAMSASVLAERSGWPGSPSWFRKKVALLPPVPPPAGFTAKVWLPRDYYLRVLGSDYSVDPAVIGRMVDVRADLDTVTARCQDTVVASRARSWARRQTITDPAHVRSAAQLRASYQQAGSSSTGRDLEEDGLVRDLAGYDTRFGIDFSSGIDTAAGRTGEVAQ